METDKCFAQAFAIAGDAAETCHLGEAAFDNPVSGQSLGMMSSLRYLAHCRSDPNCVGMWDHSMGGNRAERNVVGIMSTHPISNRPCNTRSRSSRPISSAVYTAGACQPPVTLSISRATANATSSRHGLATTWTPIGSPSLEVPPRTTTAGHPVRL